MSLVARDTQHQTPSTQAEVPGLSPRSRVALEEGSCNSQGFCLPIIVTGKPPGLLPASWAPCTGSTDVRQTRTRLCNQKWGLAARSSKTSREARLVERKWMPANGDRGRRYTCPKADFPSPTMLHQQSGGKRFYRWREGAPGRNSRVSSDAHLEIGLQRSDQRSSWWF